ncbi:Uncharacterised protein [BD1-7 clade bacterium]|uniref:Uncharacterized protein n=1 Tax=BD1-7 clade bacterium TaxID=2029982 RepID=A0A5S9MUK5_9GAMM|nr:Uncharacterised protein [BD1-7 clade bacterium]CAA0083893.1 Uncharacterised protein [BD1-7 clade bacterium]
MLNFIRMRAERACDYASNSVHIRATNKQEGINRTFEEKESQDISTRFRAGRA